MLLFRTYEMIVRQKIEILRELPTGAVFAVPSRRILSPVPTSRGKVSILLLKDISFVDENSRQDQGYVYRDMASV